MATDVELSSFDGQSGPAAWLLWIFAAGVLLVLFVYFKTLGRDES